MNECTNFLPRCKTVTLHNNNQQAAEPPHQVSQQVLMFTFLFLLSLLFVLSFDHHHYDCFVEGQQQEVIITQHNTNNYHSINDDDYSWPSEEVHQLYNTILYNGTVFYVMVTKNPYPYRPSNIPKNCTIIEDPCMNLGQVNAFLILNRKPYESVLVRFILSSNVSSWNETSDGSLALPFPVQGGNTYRYNELFFEFYDYSNVIKKGIIVNENDEYLFSWNNYNLDGVNVNGFTFLNMSLQGFSFNDRHKIIRFIDSKIGNFQSTYMSRVPEGQIIMSDAVMKDSMLNSVNIVYMKKSKLINSQMFGYNSKQVNILDSEIVNSQFKYRLLPYSDVIFTSELFQVENSILNNSTLAMFRFQNVIIKNCQAFYTSRIIQHYCETSSVDKLIAQDSFHLEASNLVQFTMINSVFETNKLNKNEATLSVSSTYSLEFLHTTFINCNNIPIYTKMVQIIFLNGCAFENNYGMLRAINDFSEGSYIRMHMGHASSNFNDDQDGTVYAYGYQSLSFEGFIFENNTARNGGAIYYYGATISGLMTHFLLNKALNNGGALYYKKENPSLVDNCELDFSNNTSINSGGAVYLEVEQSMGKNRLITSCIDNVALNAGGCVYATSQIEGPYYRAIVKNNIAYNYGPTIAFPIFNSTFHMEMLYDDGKSVNYNVGNGDILEIDIYPGQVISSIVFSNIIINDGEQLKFLSQPVEITSSKEANVYYAKQNMHDRVIDLSLNLNLKINKVNASMKFETFKTAFIFNINDCPRGMALKNPLNTVYTCLETADYSLYFYIIIPVSVIFGMILTILISAILFLIVRCFRNIYKKASLFDKKRRAEEMVEQKINNRQAVFYESDSNLSTPLLNQLSKSSLLKRSRLVIPLEDIEIINKIAEGGNGTIWLATWRSKDVALKSLKTDDNLQNEEFEKEVAVLSMLDHSSIVKLYGVCISENRKFMVVEYYPRGSLDKLIYQTKIGKESLSITQKLSILVDVAGGMTYLHSQQIVHRDLKPGNILLSTEGNARVCDFGLSKVLSSSMGATKNIGTTFYICNEMMNDSSKYTTKVDVYSFGIIMWELFFEESPYLNYNSNKIYKFRPNDSKVNEFNILFHVLNGERPVIPFTNREEEVSWIEEFVLPFNSSFSTSTLISISDKYMDLMKMCWSADPNSRPSFEVISRQLQYLLYESKETKDETISHYQSINF